MSFEKLLLKIQKPFVAENEAEYYDLLKKYEEFMEEEHPVNEKQELTQYAEWLYNTCSVLNHNLSRSKL